MAKNSCPSDSYYLRMMGHAQNDKRDWHDQTIWNQPVDHDFRSPLRRPETDIPQDQINVAFDNDEDKNSGREDDGKIAEHEQVGNEVMQEEMENGLEDDQQSEEGEYGLFSRRKSSGPQMLPSNLLKRSEAYAS